MSAHHLTNLTVGIAALALSAAAVQAQPVGPEMSVRVNVAGLDLRSEAGARVALQRVDRAAAEICGAEPDIRLLARAALYRACVRKAVEAAVASAGVPMLSELEAAKGGKTTVLASGR